MALTEFLLARIAEDEAVAREAMADDRRALYGLANLPTPTYTHVVSWGPDRVLAECEAKRQIVERMQPFGPIDDLFAPEIFALLALPYADHPDYLPEWKP